MNRFTAWLLGEPRPTPRPKPHLGEPGAQGMVVVNDQPATVVSSPRPAEKPKPRTWTIRDGYGTGIGTAVEDVETKTITVDWLPGVKVPRTRWVDVEALDDDLNHYRTYYDVTLPVRLRYNPRSEWEASLGDDG